MSIAIDGELLASMGLDTLPVEEKNRVLSKIYETLEHRVGEILTSRMTSLQVSQFSEFFDAGDHEGAFNWLQANFPDYRDVVQSEYNYTVGILDEAIRHANEERLDIFTS